MSNLSTLKKNLSDFIHAKGFDYGYDDSEIDEMLSELIYADLYDAIQNQQQCVYTYTEFEPFSDWINACAQRKSIMDATLISRLMAYENDDFELGRRRYLELWIDENMDLQVVSCFESIRTYDGYVTQHRELLEPVWPDEEVAIDIEDLCMVLVDMCWNTSGFDAVPIFDIYE